MVQKWDTSLKLRDRTAPDASASRESGQGGLEPSRCVWSSTHPDGRDGSLPQIGCPLLRTPLHWPTGSGTSSGWAVPAAGRQLGDRTTPPPSGAAQPPGQGTGCSRSSPGGPNNAKAQLSEQGWGRSKGAREPGSPGALPGLSSALGWHASCGCLWPWGFSLHARLTGWESRHTLLSLSVGGISFSSKDVVRKQEEPPLPPAAASMAGLQKSLCT